MLEWEVLPDSWYYHCTRDIKGVRENGLLAEHGKFVIADTGEPCIWYTKKGPYWLPHFSTVAILRVDLSGMPIRHLHSDIYISPSNIPTNRIEIFSQMAWQPLRIRQITHWRPFEWWKAGSRYVSD